MLTKIKMWLLDKAMTLAWIGAALFAAFFAGKRGERMKEKVRDVQDDLNTVRRAREAQDASRASGDDWHDRLHDHRDD